MRVIDKTGPLSNPADRDHCLQYMVAIGLLFGTLTAEDYEDHIAADPRRSPHKESKNAFLLHRRKITLPGRLKPCRTSKDLLTKPSIA
jgi:hypothetical protein